MALYNNYRSQNDEIAELRARLQALEQNQGKNSGYKPKQDNGDKLKNFFKKNKKLFVIIGIILVFAIAIIAVSVSFIGIRGVYVNVDDPYESYSFTATGYEYRNKNMEGEMYVDKGTWKKSGNKITLTVDDEMFGKVDTEYTVTVGKGNNSITLVGGMFTSSEDTFNRVSKVNWALSKNKKAKITFDLNGGTTEEEIKNLEVKFGTVYEYDLPTPTNENGTFKGWYTTPDGYKTEGQYYHSKSPAYNDTTYYANWFLYSECEGHEFSSRCVCIHCNYVEHDIDEDCICTNCNQSLHELDEDCICVNCNQIVHELDENCVCGGCEKTLHAFDGVCRHGDYVYFGSYPQTIKADNVIITSTTNNKGYYLGSDNEWYAKVTASPCNSGYTFSTGTTVTSGAVYYFKVEPIRWRILRESNGKAFILCDSIIATHRYDDRYNDYADSEIRTWLNDTFYKTAFSTLQQELILTTTVDNSVASTGYDGNEYACEDTNDKVFLLSYAEATNSSYGFSSAAYDEARRMITSDYSRATGACMDTKSSYYGNGVWWLRSPYGLSSNYSCLVHGDGYVYNFSVDYTYYGVVPAMWIELE